MSDGGEKENKCMRARGRARGSKRAERKRREGADGRKSARTESEQGRRERDTMMEDRREVGRPRKDEQTKYIRISLASVKTSDDAPLEIFLAATYRCRLQAIHRAVDASQLTESSEVIDRRIGQTQRAL